MIKKYLILLIYITFISHTTFSQNINCNEIRSEKIPKFSENDRTAILETLRIVSYCLTFDSTDSLIFNEVSLSTLILGNSNQDTPLTYGSLIDMVQNVRQSEFYDKTRINVQFYNKFENKIISKKDSSEVYKGFQSLHESINTDSLIAFIYNPDNKGLTYKHAYSNYLDILNGIDEFQSQAESLSVYQPLNNYNTVLELLKNTDKKVILYFTGYNCVNGRKFETKTLYQPNVIQYIKDNYHFFTLYIDDKSNLDEETKNNIYPLNFKNKGEYSRHIQNQLLNHDYQTVLAILNKEGKIIYSEFVSSLTEDDLLQILKSKAEEK